MSDFDEIKFNYAIYYKFIGLLVRGKLDPIGIFKEYWYGRRVDKLYSPSQPRTGKQQGQRALLYDAVENWQGFDQPTKFYYNKWAKYKPLSGYNRYLSLYMRANYPMIVYWEPLAQSATQPLKIAEYFAEPYFLGVQRVRTFATYPTSPPYGSVIRSSVYNRIFAFLQGVGWAALQSDENVRLAAITFIIDGGGSVITTGIKGDLRIPFDCEITKVTLMADQVGSIVVDIWKDTLANFPPLDADSITAAAPPTISGDTDSEDNTLTGWTKTLLAGDILRFNVDSIATIERVTLELKVEKTS